MIAWRLGVVDGVLEDLLPWATWVILEAPGASAGLDALRWGDGQSGVVWAV